MTRQLTPKDLYEIGESAKEKRRLFDIGMGPLGDNIFKLVRKLDISLIFYPIQIEEERSNQFSALYCAIDVGHDRMRFIGVNTYDYYDKQIFALAHELYHHFESSGTLVCRIQDDPDELRELRANRFAAEFLLPSDTLRDELLAFNDGQLMLSNLSYTSLLRFIARLHCDYRLPYKAIVRRLNEIGAVTDEQHDRLMVESVRTEDTRYYWIALTINKHVFEHLNARTMEVGADGEKIGKLIQSFEDELIPLPELAEDLLLFGKSIDEFGLEEAVDDADLADVRELFEETGSGEEKHN